MSRAPSPCTPLFMAYEYKKKRGVRSLRMPPAVGAIGALGSFPAISLLYCALLHVELYMELRNSRVSPQTLHRPELVGPFGLSMSQKCTHILSNAEMWIAVDIGDPTILPTSGRRDCPVLLASSVDSKEVPPFSVGSAAKERGQYTRPRFGCQRPVLADGVLIWIG